MSQRLLPFRVAHHGATFLRVSQLVAAHDDDQVSVRYQICRLHQLTRVPGVKQIVETIGVDTYRAW